MTKRSVPVSPQFDSLLYDRAISFLQTPSVPAVRKKAKAKASAAKKTGRNHNHS